MSSSTRASTTTRRCRDLSSTSSGFRRRTSLGVGRARTAPRPLARSSGSRRYSGGKAGAGRRSGRRQLDARRSACGRQARNPGRAHRGRPPELRPARCPRKSTACSPISSRTAASPTVPEAADNLQREGIGASRIYFVGNTMIDTLVRCARALRSRRWCVDSASNRDGYVLVTLHRPELVDGPLLEDALAALSQLARSMPVVFPVHPRTRARLRQLPPRRGLHPGRPARLPRLPRAGRTTRGRRHRLGRCAGRDDVPGRAVLHDPRQHRAADHGHGGDEPPHGAGSGPRRSPAQCSIEKLINGRIEDLTGWIFFNQDKYSAAIEHLKLATATLPNGTPSWRDALWHLGVAYEQTAKNQLALDSYIDSDNSGERDPIRRAVIERLYRKVNGSAAGLDDRIGPSPTASAAGSTATESTTPPSSVPETTATSSTPATTQPSPEKTTAPTETPQTEAPKPEATPEPLFLLR